MSIDLKQILGIAQNTNFSNLNITDVLASVSPKIVLTAPSGRKLYIDISPEASGSSDTSPPLWPAGFTVGLKTGAVPADPLATASPTEFFIQESPTLLAAPGFLGISWGTWLLFLLAIILFPFLAYHVFKK